MSFPIAHFAGQFRFEMPGYNNDPNNEAIPFDPNVPPEKVQQTCECDPTHYYEFSFFDTKVTQATYSDVTQATSGDSLIGQQLSMTGFLPDVSPSAICAQLYAGRLALGSIFTGHVRKAIQSDLRFNIRTKFSDETAGAWFETVLDIDAIAPTVSSRVVNEWAQAGIKQLEIHFHVNHYTRMDNTQSPESARLTGDVYGYIRPVIKIRETTSGIRLSQRRVVAHSKLADNPQVATLFLSKPGTSVMRITDIDGTFDLFAESKALTLRYLDFVPMLDRDHNTPTVDYYRVSIERDGTSVEIGRFLGTHDEMRRSGGLQVFQLPPSAGGWETGRMRVDVVKAGSYDHPLMIESEWDLALETDRGLTLASAMTSDVVVRVFKNNRPVAGHPVSLRSEENGRSPVVATFPSESALTDAEGRLRVTLQALDLARATDVNDPVTEGKLQGPLPWDRYYGSYVYLSIPNQLRWTVPAEEVVEIAVRVVHRIDPIPASPSFARHIRPLFSYYLRYFPWLHTRFVGGAYRRFFNPDDYADFSGKADAILMRLNFPEDHPDKMPRSRDFPIGGVELIKRWIDAGMQP